MNNSNNNPVWVIRDLLSGKYFSLLGSAHFTDNLEIAQRFDSEADAVLCEEEHINSDVAFLAYETRPVILQGLDLNLSFATTEQLKAEMKKRRYQMDNLWQTEDVNSAIEQINEDDDREVKLVLTEKQKEEALIFVLSSDNVMEAINVALSDFLYEEYPED